MPWEDHLKYGGQRESQWLSENLSGSENKLWKFGKDAYRERRAEELSGLTEWLKKADFESRDIGGEAEQNSFCQLATGMANGLAALGEGMQGNSAACQAALQRAAAAYQQFLEPAAVLNGTSDALSLSLTETADVERVLDGGLVAAEKQYPAGGSMLRTLLAGLVPGLQEAKYPEVRLRVLLDSRLSGEAPLLYLRRYAAPDNRRLWHPDPVQLGCTMLNREFLKTLDQAWKFCEDALPKKEQNQGCRISWGLQLDTGSTHLRGPSAGAVFAAGLRGLAEGLEFDTGVAMTAAISDEGQLESVGDIPDKIKAACDNGVRHFVLCPDDAEKHRDGLEAKHPDITIVPADNVDDTLEHLTGDAQAVRKFLENLINEGLKDYVSQRPRDLKTGREIDGFCLPPRVVDIEKESSENKDETRVVPQRLFPPRGRVVLEGAPGKGKTTALWLMVAEQCKDLLDKLKDGKPVTTASELRVPLVLPLIGVDSADRPHLTHLARDFVLSMACGDPPEEAPEKLRKWLDGKIERDEYTLYLDALDELPGAEPARKWLWSQTNRIDIDVPLLLTTRTSVSHETEIRDPQRYRMADLGTREVRQYVERYFQDPQDLAGDVLDRQRLSKATRRLMQLPLFLAMLCDRKRKHPNEPLPRTRTELLRAALYELFKRGDEKRAKPSSTTRHLQKEQVLRYVAWEFTRFAPMPMKKRELLQVLRERQELISKHPVEDEEVLLNEFITDGILVQTRYEQYGFVLRTFHEYCQAGWIAISAEKWPVAFQNVISGSATQWGRPDWGDLYPLYHDAWEGVWPLVAGQMAENGNGGWLLTVLVADAHDSGDYDPVRVARVAAEVPEDCEERRKFQQEVIDCRFWGDEPTLPLSILADDVSRDTLIRWLDPHQPSPGRAFRFRCVQALGHIGDEQSREAIISLLSAPNITDWIRRYCATALGNIGDEPSREALISLLSAPNITDGIRGNCAMALGNIGDEPSREALIAGLHNPNTAEACVSGLYAFDDDQTRDAFIAFLNDPDPDTTLGMLTCVFRLPKFGDEPSREALITRLDDSETSEVIRKQCATALGLIADERSRDVLITRLDDSETSEGIRKQCATALGKIGDVPSRGALITRLDDSETSEGIRKQCATALGKIGDVPSRGALITRLDDSETSEGIRKQCATALGKIGDVPSRDVLITRLDDSETSEGIRKQCATALGKIGDVPSRGALITRLDDSDTPERICKQCATALGLIADERSRDVLITRLDDSETSEKIRVECATALGKIGDELSREALITRLDDSHTPKGIRQECVTALGKIGDELSCEALIAQLHNPDALESTRFMCAWRLGEFTTNCYKLATEALWEATADYPESLASECGLILAQMGWEPESD